MAVLTVSSYFQKGSPVLISVSKPELLELIDSDYFEDMDHWNKIILKYKSPTGQFERIVCNGQDAIPSAFFQISTKADDLFQINQIIIMDFDGKIYVIDRSILAEVITLDINYAQEEEVDYTLFSTTGSNGSFLAVTEDEKLAIVKNNYDTFYGSRRYFHAVLETETSEINETLTKFINYHAVESYYFNEDYTKVYLGGRFGTSFMDRPLPALPVPTAPYSSSFVNPSRLIVVDTATNDVTWIGDIPFNSDSNYDADIAFTVLADEESDMLVTISSSKIFGYKISTSQKIWEKNIGYYDGAATRRKMYLYDSGSFLLGHMTSYDNVSFTYNRPVKINILTGEIDNSFPVCPEDIGQYGRGNSPLWALTPDKTKIIQIASYNTSKFFIFQNGSWTFIEMQGDVYVAQSMDVSNTDIYFGKGKWNFQGVRDSSYLINLYEERTWLKYAGSKIYSAENRFNTTTGVLDNSYVFYNAVPLRATDELVFFSKSRTVQIAMYGHTEYYYGGRVAVIDLETKQKKYSFANSNNNYYLNSKILFGGADNRSYFNFEFGRSPFWEVYTLTDTSAVRDTTYPEITASGGFGGTNNDGDWVYTCSHNTGANTFTVTQTSGQNIGTHTINSKLCRINHITKEVDLTFAPQIPNDLGGIISISFTDDYIYLFGTYNSWYVNYSQFYRVHKTTQAVQKITSQLLNITTPSSLESIPGQLNAVKSGTNKVVLYFVSNGYRFNDRPYMVFNEDTLTPVESQPAVSTYTATAGVTYNSSTNELVGFFIFNSDTVFLAYNLSTNAKITHDVFKELYTNTSLFTSKVENYLSLGSPTLVPYKDTYLLHSTGVYVKKQRPYSGVIKLPLIGQTVNPTPALVFDQRNSSTYISFSEPNKVLRLDPNANLDTPGSLGAYWSTKEITSDFTFVATVKAGLSSESIIQALFGITDTFPVGQYGVKATGWGISFDHASRTVKPWDKASNSLAWTAGSTYNIEIKRVSGVVSYKVNDTVFTYTLSTSATLYLVGYLQVGSWEVTNYSLTEP